MKVESKAERKDVKTRHDGNGREKEQVDRQASGRMVEDGVEVFSFVEQICGRRK